MKIYSYFFLIIFLFSTNSVHGYTKEDVLQRQQLNCGVLNNVPGFSAMDENGNWIGFNVDICRAVAAAVLGDEKLAAIVPLAAKGAYTSLLTGEVDLLLLHTTQGEWNLTLDATRAVHFVVPTFYDEFGAIAALSAGGEPLKNLDKIRPCITKQSHGFEERFLQQLRIRGDKIYYETKALATRGFIKGECGLLVQPRSLLWHFEKQGFGTVLPETFGRIIFSPIVRQGDDNWFNIVRWTVFAMLNAEAAGLTSDNAEVRRLSNAAEMRRFFGYEGSGGQGLGLADDWAAQIITQIGNYGEIFARNLGSSSPLKIERGKNNLWNKGGLHFPPPMK